MASSHSHNFVLIYPSLTFLSALGHEVSQQYPAPHSAGLSLQSTETTNLLSYRFYSLILVPVFSKPSPVILVGSLTCLNTHLIIPIFKVSVLPPHLELRERKCLKGCLYRANPLPLL